MNLKKYGKITKVPVSFLKKLGLEDNEYKGKTSLKIPYFDRDHNEINVRYRNSVKGPNRFRWKTGLTPTLYGLWRLNEAEKKGYIVIVEGESDCHILWYHKIPAIGVPGANLWKEERDADHLKDIKKIYFMMEPDQGGRDLLRQLLKSSLKSRIKVIRLKKKCKDPREIYLADPDGFKTAIKEARKSAKSIDQALPYAYDKIRKGHRNTELTSIAGKLRAEGYSEEKLKATLKLINKKRCKPRLDESEVEAIVDSIKQYEPGKSDSSKSSLDYFRTNLLSNLKTFHTAIKEGYAVIDVENRQETLAIRSKEFSNLLQKQYYNEHKKVISQADLDRIIGLLDANARFESELREVHIRVAGSEKAVYLDLANQNREVIKITSETWCIITDPPYHFIRPTGMMALPHPKVEKDGKFRLKSFLKADKLLIVAWLLGSMNPSGPYPILVLQGGPGSAKSTTSKLLKQLIDPSEGPLRTPPRDIRDLMISARNSWVLAFDNLSRFSGWLSDAFCQLSTGGGLSVRKQYTNTQEQIFNAVRPVILNGIDDLAVRADLADRSIVIELPSISDKNRVSERELWARIENDKPYILGSIINGVSEALKNLSKVNLKTKPRMADFTQWVVAAEPAMPWKNNLFLKKYQKNIETKSRICLHNDYLALTIVAFMNKKKQWKGTADDLLNDLKAHLSYQNKDLKGFPNSPAAIGKELKRAVHVLEKNSVEVVHNRTSKKRLIRLKSKVVSD